MWRAFWISAAAIGVIVGGLVWVAATATFLYRHPGSPDVRIEIDKRTGSPVVVAKAAPKGEAAKPSGQPRAMANEFVHDFGTMDPLSDGEHEFFIENRGDAPLHLQVGPTTCKCTVSGLADKVVPPGGTTAVTLQWNTGRVLAFSQSALIGTNDPRAKSLEFRVDGKVRMLIGADVQELVAPRIEPNQPTTVEALVYSQIWDGFEIENLDSKVKGLAWEAAVVDPAATGELNAKAVQRLRLTIPADLPQGQLEDVLRLQIHPAGEVKRYTLDLPIRGTVLRRLAVYGPTIDETGIIDLGALPHGKGAKARLVIKIRDSEPNIDQAKLEVTPELIQVRLARHVGDPASGLYDLTVEVPANTPVCQYRASPIGKLRIDTGHPRIGQVELGISFVVVPRQSL